MESQEMLLKSLVFKGQSDRGSVWGTEKQERPRINKSK